MTAKKVLPRSKKKDVHGRFREYFAAWMQEYPAVAEVPPEYMLFLLKLTANNPQELIDLIRFTRRYKEASKAATIEDVRAALDVLKVNSVIES